MSIRTLLELACDTAKDLEVTMSESEIIWGRTINVMAARSEVREAVGRLVDERAYEFEEAGIRA